MKARLGNWRSLLLEFAVLLGLGSMQPQAALAAEKVVFGLVGSLDLEVSLESLEEFAAGEEPEGNLSLITRRLDESEVEILRNALQQRLDIDAVTLSRASRTPIVTSVYKRLGRVIRGNNGRGNYWHAIRGAVTGAAAHPDGLSLLNVMRQYPLETIRVDFEVIVELNEELSALLSYRDAVTEAIALASEAEIAAASPDVTHLSDLRQPGAYPVEKEVLPLRIRTIRQTRVGLAESYQFETDIYFPQGLEQSAPLIVISHGFGDRPETFAPYARHLASHGYMVAVPEHIGSDGLYREGLFRGQVPNTTSPIEYINRPLDIIYLLDELERLAQEDPAWRDRINFEQIGVMGHSFGGYTALTVAGAPLNQARLATCDEEEITLNVSLLLQCQARHLPPVPKVFTDERIKAVIAVNPITSQALGPESLAEIEIPTLMVTGTHDLVAPSIQEQVHPFLWLQTPNKYLAAMVRGTHNSITENPDRPDEGALSLLSGPRPDLGRAYLQGLSLAFFETYVREDRNYQPYLSAAYARQMSDRELSLYLIESLTPEQLVAAFGKEPPFAVIPEPVRAIAPPPAEEETVLAQIEREGVLKIAMREDAPPFGYLDGEGVWTGYCFDFANRLATFVAERLERAEGVEVVRLPSTLENRFDLVADGTVHLECGPNTIRSDVEEDVAFSPTFFITGTQFLVPAAGASQLTPADRVLEGKTGVLDDSTTEQFLSENYDRAEVVTFEGATGRAVGIQALLRGEIDAFASDGVLLLGEVARQGLPLDDFVLVPERPLTCDFYGLIVPANDPQWNRTLGDFIAEDKSSLSREWAGRLSFDLIEESDRCLNRAPRE